MTKKRKKVKYHKKVVTPLIKKVDESIGIKKEIAELEAKKGQAGKGVRGFLRRMALNKQISDKRGYITAKDRLRTTRQQTELVRTQVDLENARASLKEARKKSQVDFGGLGMGYGNSKQIKAEDIFK